MIPMVDLKKQLDEIKQEVLSAVREVIEGGQYILGKRVEEFEAKTADYLGTKHAVGVASGTDALHLAMRALGIGPGDEVITTPFTFFSTVEAIVYLGATPVFADIAPCTFNIDPGQIEKKLTPKTKAILPVHMFGYPAPMEEILSIAQDRGLKVVEDCAQSFGAAIRDKKTGGFGDMGCFSFYPSKNLGGYGDGGLICLNDENLMQGLKELRNHGSAGGYIHNAVGYNSRLDELQAAILLVKLRRIDEYNEKRRKKAAFYSKCLGYAADCPKPEEKGFYHVFHQYTIRHPRRDFLRERLKEEGVSSMIYYPLPLHLQPATRFLGHSEGDFPNAERVSHEVLSLPIYPELEDAVIVRICEIVRSV